MVAKLSEEFLQAKALQYSRMRLAKQQALVEQERFNLIEIQVRKNQHEINLEANLTTVAAIKEEIALLLKQQKEQVPNG